MVSVSATKFRPNLWSDDNSVFYAQGSDILDSCPVEVVVRQVELVEQLGQPVECLLVLVSDHSAKLGLAPRY